MDETPDPPSPETWDPRATSPALGEGAEAAPDSLPSPWLPVIAGWLVPGAGHMMIRRPWPAIFVAASVLPLYVGGMALAGWLNVSYQEHPWYFAAHVFAGAPTGLALVLTRGMVATEPLAYRSAGELYTAMAGLLNLVAVADVWARCHHGDPYEAPPESAEASEDAETSPDA